MEVNANIADLNGDILIKTPDRDYRLNGKATIKVDNTHGQMKKTYLINPTHEQGEELSFCYDFLQQANTCHVKSEHYVQCILVSQWLLTL